MNSENVKKGQAVKVDFIGTVDHIRDGYVQVRNSDGWVLAPVEVLREMEEPGESPSPKHRTTEVIP